MQATMVTTGLPRHRENREFESPFFQTGNTQGIYHQHRENLSVLKNKKKRTCNLSGWNYPLAVLCQDLGLYVILAAVMS